MVLATYNEAENISDCLKSVKDIVSEIIIVDGQSTDKTVDLAKEFGAKVFIKPNDPLFHKNKQFAIDKATQEWILQLDADERVSPQLSQEIKTTLEGKSNLNGYFLPRKNWFLGRFLAKGGVYPDPVLRLFRRGKGWFNPKPIYDNNITTSNVHAQIEIKGEVGYLKNDLIHYSDPDLNKYLKRMNRYTSLEAENLIKLGTKINFIETLNYMIIKPSYWFLKRYLRHRGYVDGFQGFLYAVLSALHYPFIYIKAWELTKSHGN